MKKKLLISFSGGLTSAYMTYRLLDEYRGIFDDVVTVFANTGREREETLEFIKMCDDYFGFGTHWVECITNPVNGRGVSAKIVNFETADRTGKVFEESIAKHGISNISSPSCTRELKAYTINAFMRMIGWKKYNRAIGIRVDEVDRINPKHEKERIIYPCISIFPIIREDVNAFWLKQPFTLNLKSYEGNCDVCWKKSLRKLLTLAVENPQLFDWWIEMEERYGDYIPESRKHNPKIKPPFKFFRGNLSAREILEMSKGFTDFARDESKDIIQYRQLELFGCELDVSNGCTESCEPF